MKFDNMRFSKEHEWVRRDDGSNLVTIGITDFAAGELGDIVFVELPAVGVGIESNQTVGTIEAVKTVADLYAPVSGVVKAVNEKLADEPGIVNQSPYEEGWFIKVEMSNPSDLDGLMTMEAYNEMVGKG